MDCPRAEAPDHLPFPAPPRPATGLSLARLAGLPLLGLLLLGACEKKQEGAAQRPAAPPATVLVAAAAQQPVSQNIEFVGRVEALEKVDIRARVTGFLRQQHFTDGQDVAEGDLLFTIEREPFEAQVALRQAQIESAQAELNNANYQVERGRELVRTNALPRATLDQRVADQGMAAAKVSGARAELRVAEIDLSYTEIRSPIAGRAGRAAITRGNVVGPDSGVLVTVVRRDPIRVTFPITQRQLLDLRQRYQGPATNTINVRLRLPNGTMYDQVGRVNFLDVQTDRATDSATVQAEIPNPQGLLSDGQFIGVVVEDPDPRTMLVIPQSAVQMDQAGAFVLVVGQDNKVEQRRVTLSRGPAGQAVVENGLEAGSRVITEGAQRARPGAVVTPRAATPAPSPGPLGAPARAG